MLVFLILGALCAGVAFVGVVTVASSRRTQIVDRVTAYVEYGGRSEDPAKTAFALDLDPKQSLFSALATFLGERLAGRVGAIGEDAIREQLMKAGMYTVSPRTVIGYRILATIGLPALGVLLIGLHSALGILVIVLVTFIGWILPLTFVQRKARRRVAELDRALPDLIDLLCVMIEAGLSFSAALRLASDQFGPPLSDELRLTLQEQTMGLGIDEALGNMADRADTPAVKSFVRAMAQGERMGISTGQIMRNLSHEMRHRRRSQAEERAQKTPVLMLFPLVFMIFPAMFIILMTPAMINVIHSLKGGF